MNNRDIQHPDITEAERTGYPREIPGRVEVDVTEGHIAEFLTDDRTEFIQWAASNEIGWRYIQTDPDYFRQWMSDRARR